VRCNINKARKHNIHVAVDEKQHLVKFHEYHEALLKSYHKPILPLQYYESVAQLPCVHIFSALYEKVPIAVGIILTHHDTVYYWNNASAFEYRNYRPNDLLVWEIIKWAKERNFHVFDFLIVPLTELPGLTRFKLKFQPKLYPVYEYQAKNKYQIMSKGLYYLSRPYEFISKLCSTFFKFPS
jgi:lipid II:glycine glycyltransferase (peptidoglycan interpeptide bridge formation enzyme)